MFEEMTKREVLNLDLDNEGKLIDDLAFWLQFNRLTSPVSA